MRLAKGVAARDQRHGFLVIHRHAAERLTDVVRGGYRIGIAVGAFGIDVDEAHLRGGERTLQAALAVEAPFTGRQELGLRPPIDEVGFPGIDTAAGEADRLETHILQRDVAGEDHQVAPGYLAAIFLLDRPDQAARLVQADIVGPGIQRLETLFAAPRAATAVDRAIGARAMPGHADEEGTVIAIVRWPPRLRGGERGVDVPLHRLKVERGEFLRIVEIGAIGIGLRRMLAQRRQVQPVRPPILVGHGTGRRLGRRGCGIAVRHGRRRHDRDGERHQREGVPEHDSSCL